MLLFWYASKICKVGWLVVLRINVDLAIFQPYLDLEAGDNQSLKIQVARPGIEPRSSCSASQELNHSTTAAPRSQVYKMIVASKCWQTDRQMESKLKELKKNNYLIFLVWSTVHCIDILYSYMKRSQSNPSESYWPITDRLIFTAPNCSLTVPPFIRDIFCTSLNYTYTQCNPTWVVFDHKTVSYTMEHVSEICYDFEEHDTHRYI